MIHTRRLNFPTNAYSYAKSGGFYLWLPSSMPITHTVGSLARCATHQLQPQRFRDSFGKRDCDGTRSVASVDIDGGCGIDHQCIDDTDCVHCSALPRVSGAGASDCDGPIAPHAAERAAFNFIFCYGYELVQQYFFPSKDIQSLVLFLVLCLPNVLQWDISRPVAD